MRVPFDCLTWARARGLLAHLGKSHTLERTGYHPLVKSYMSDTPPARSVSYLIWFTRDEGHPTS